MSELMSWRVAVTAVVVIIRDSTCMPLSNCNYSKVILAIVDEADVEDDVRRQRGPACTQSHKLHMQPLQCRSHAASLCMALEPILQHCRRSGSTVRHLQCSAASLQQVASEERPDTPTGMAGADGRACLSTCCCKTQDQHLCDRCRRIAGTIPTVSCSRQTVAGRGAGSMRHPTQHTGRSARRILHQLGSAPADIAGVPGGI